MTSPDWQRLRADDIEIHYRIWGETGTPLFLLHGLGSDSRQFEWDAEQFSGSGFRVIVPDLRGHGRSFLPRPLTAEAMHVSQMARDISRLMSHLQLDEAHFVGNSMGGVVALDLIGRSPGSVCSLTTFGTVYSLDLPAHISIMRNLVGRILGARRLADMTARSVSERENTQAMVRLIYADLNLDMVAAVQKTLRRYDYRDIAAAFPRPILILRGDRDRHINKYLPETLRALEGRANVHLIDIADAGHFTNTDQPQEIVDRITCFLKKADA